MRRRLGAGYTLSRQKLDEKYAAAAEKLNSAEIDASLSLINSFSSRLAEFAAKHKQRINEDPLFRQNFYEMCSSLSLDPASSNRGYWGQIFDIADFYAELGIQILTVCLATREVNGGILDIQECLARLEREDGWRRSNEDNSTVNIKGKSASRKKLHAGDVVVAISKLKILGEGGIKFVKNSSKDSTETLFIVSVPFELNQDVIVCLRLAQSLGQGYISVELIISSLEWSYERSLTCARSLVQDGIAWLDVSPRTGVTSYWFPSFFFSRKG